MSFLFYLKKLILFADFRHEPAQTLTIFCGAIPFIEARCPDLPWSIFFLASGMPLKNCKGIAALLPQVGVEKQLKKEKAEEQATEQQPSYACRFIIKPGMSEEARCPAFSGRVRRLTGTVGRNPTPESAVRREPENQGLSASRQNFQRFL